MNEAKLNVGVRDLLAFSAVAGAVFALYVGSHYGLPRFETVFAFWVALGFIFLGIHMGYDGTRLGRALSWLLIAMAVISAPFIFIGGGFLSMLSLGTLLAGGPETLGANDELNGAFLFVYYIIPMAGFLVGCYFYRLNRT